jgi:glucarate dehydratase
MKIDHITCTVVNVPLDKPYFWSYGELGGFTKTIVEVVTDDGLVGLGEAPGAGSATLILNDFAPRLKGQDPIDIQNCESLCLPPFRGMQSWHDFPRIRAFGGLEVALWDIRGKAWNQPLCQLLGGAVRHDIPFTDYFGFRPGEETPEAVADWCVMLSERHGTSFFEGKFSAQDHRKSIRMIEAIRSRLGEDVMIRIDSNQAYSVNTARELAPALEELNIRNWEDPVSSPVEMRQLRQFTTIPFSGHNMDLQITQAFGAPDAIVTDPSNAGGILRLMKFIAAAEEQNVDVWMYSGDSGIMSAAYLHVCAASQHVREPNQSLFRWQPHDVIAEGPFSPKNNVVPVPKGPGLGVTLDRDRLKFLAKDFEKNGPYDKHHDRYSPGRYRLLPYDPMDVEKNGL